MHDDFTEKTCCQEGPAGDEYLLRCLAGALAADHDCEGVVRLAASLCSAPIAAFSLVTGKEQQIIAAIGMASSAGGVGRASTFPVVAPLTAGFVSRTVFDPPGDAPNIIEDTAVLPETASNSWCTGPPHLRSYVGLKVTFRNQPVGALFVAAGTPLAVNLPAVSNLAELSSQLSALMQARAEIMDLRHELDQRRKEQEDLKSQIDQIHAYSRELQVHAVRLESINARLEALAKLDGMTGLKNHRAFQERLDFEFQRAMRYSMPMSLMLLDVDHFKQFNDTFGHLAGDEVLKTVAMVLQDNARGVDFVARYGGEEFVVILPHADEKSSLAIGERLRAAIEGVVWPLSRVTASIGLSTLMPGMTTASDLIAMSDRALYHSKTAGRNRVTHVGQLGGQTK